MESGTFVLNNTIFSLLECLEEIHEVFINQCEQKRIKFNYKINNALIRKSIKTDKGRLKQILMNLIANALKFTFEGSIILNLFLGEINGDKMLIFKVTDSGIGIKETDKEKLFTLFGMISEARAINPNGTGIGLTVCKKYCEKLGGGIKLESEYGQGTTVIFWIPFIEEELNSQGSDEQIDFLEVLDERVESF
jgi:signal transduction histidine kinase